MKVLFFPNGNTAAFENGQQVPLYQESWFLLYVQLVAATGKDPTEIEFTMPDGSKSRVFELPDGRYTWEILGELAKG